MLRQWGDKVIGRSIYRVVKVRDYAFAIQELRDDGRSAMTSPYYAYYDDAMAAIRDFNDEFMVLRGY